MDPKTHFDQDCNPGMFLIMVRQPRWWWSAHHAGSTGHVCLDGYTTPQDNSKTKKERVSRT